MVTGTGGYPAVPEVRRGAGEDRTAPVYAARMDPGPADPDKPAQGWFVDPFGIHEQRWFSQGTPSALVRDGRTEGQDPPPDTHVEGPLVPAAPAARPTGLGDDRTRVDPRDRAGRPDARADAVGDPVVPTTADPAPSVADPGGQLPRRMVRMRWLTFGFAVVWTLLLTGLLLTATTTTHLRDGHTRSATVVSSDTGGVLLFLALLLATVAVTGVGFVRRIRSHSQAAGRAGYVCAAVLGLLGVLSLNSIGLTLIILGATLATVARPLKRPRPLPGERVV